MVGSSAGWFVKFLELGSGVGGEEDGEGAEDGGGGWRFEDGGEGLVVERMGGGGFGFEIGGHGAPVGDGICVDGWVLL
jgi:hypothetical protein